jgi:hypothetical protein
MICRDRLAGLCVWDKFSPQVPGAVDDLTMTDQQDDSERPDVAAQDPRRERLKQALRENLKRRKSQIRERGKRTSAPSIRHETALDEKSPDGDE